MDLEVGIMSFKNILKINSFIKYIMIILIAEKGFWNVKKKVNKKKMSLKRGVSICNK